MCSWRSLAAVALALALPATASAAPPRGFVGLSADDMYGKPGAYRDKALTQQHRVIGHHHPHGPYAATFTELSDFQRPIAL